VRVLIVEDEPKVAATLRRGLQAEAIPVDLATSGEEALWRAAATGYAAIVLDVMLPGIDGFETCRRLRDQGIWTPVLMLSARATVDDRVTGLYGGADDYLVKPFSFAELLARLHVLARRGAAARPVLLAAGDLRLDPREHRMWRGDDEISLSAKEFSLMRLFMERPGAVLSRYDLLEQAWDDAYENRSNVIEVHIKNIRAKVDRPDAESYIETVRGVGYRLCVPR
jgi:two-component system OmpR family response regulator